MRDTEFKALPNSVREHYLNIPDTHFDKNEQVIKLRSAHADAKREFNKASEQHDKVRSVIAASNESAEIARQYLADIESKRGHALAREFLDGGLFEEDDRMLDEIHALRKTIERVTLAQPVLEGMRRDRNRKLDVAADHVFEASQRITELIERMKLDEAYRLAGA